MSKKRMVDTRFWYDDYVQDLDPIEKLLFLYFLTNPATDICGIYELPLKTAAVDTGIDRDMLGKVLKRFEDDKKVFYVGGWVAVRNAVFYQTLNPSVRRGIENGLNRAPKDVLDRLGTEWVQAVRECIEGRGNLNLNSNSNLNLIESLNDIFSFWNEKKTIEHRKLTTEIEKEITKALENYTSEEIKAAIDTYATVLEKGVDEKDKIYFWSYCWTLSEFLKRGMKQFYGKSPDDYKKKSTNFSKAYKPQVDTFDLSKK